jgi:hypothetical protein
MRTGQLKSKLLLAAMIVFLSCVTSYAELTYKDMMFATARLNIKRPNLSEVGTGTVYKYDSEYMYLITAGHVIENHKGAINTLAFNRGGEFTRSYKFEVIKYLHPKDSKYAGSHNDIGLLKVALSEIDYRPKAIPLAEHLTGFGASVSSGDILFTCGCPSGGWPTALFLKCTAVKYENQLIEFLPLPKTGRSGSAIFKDFQIVGIISGFKHKSKEDESKGVAPSFYRIRDWMENDNRVTLVGE